MDTNRQSEEMPEGAQARECRWFHERLGSYLDSALSPQHMRRAARHVELCGDCQSAASSLENMLAEARDCRAIQVGPDFEDAIWRRIGREAALAQAGRDWSGSGWLARLAESFSPAGRLAWAGVATAAVLLVATVTIRQQAPGVAKTPADSTPLLASQAAPLPAAQEDRAARSAAGPGAPAVPGTADDRPASAPEGAGAATSPRASATPRRVESRPMVVGQMYGDGLTLTSNGGAGGWRRAPVTVTRRVAPAPQAAGPQTSGPQVSGESPFGGEQYVLERVEWVSDPEHPERGAYILRRVVATSAGQGLSF